MTEFKQVALCPQSPPWVRKYNAETNRTFVFLLIFGLNCKLSVTPQDNKIQARKPLFVYGNNCLCSAIKEICNAVSLT